MNRSPLSKSILWVVVALLCALALSTVLLIRDNRLQTDLRAKTTLLSESRDKWESVSKDNELLSDQLDAINGQIREAEKSLEEAETRRNKIQTQIAELNEEIESLKKVAP